MKNNNFDYENFSFAYLYYEFDKIFLTFLII